MVLSSLAVSFKILEDAAFTAHVKTFIKNLRDPCFDIDLFKTGVENVEDCCLMASVFMKNL